jgi:hypothetical protein
MDSIETHPEIVQVPTYDVATGLRGWHDNDELLSVRVSPDGGITISANPAGLRGLARELLGLAQQGVPEGNEVYLTSKGQAPTLAPGSPSLVIVRSPG